MVNMGMSSCLLCNIPQHITPALWFFNSFVPLQFWDRIKGLEMLGKESTAEVPPQPLSKSYVKEMMAT